MYVRWQFQFMEMRLHSFIFQIQERELLFFRLFLHKDNMTYSIFNCSCHKCLISSHLTIVFQCTCVAVCIVYNL